MDDIENPAVRKELEYAVQYFDFSPDVFCNTILGDSSQIVRNNLKLVSDQIGQSYSSEVVNKDELDKSMEKLANTFTEKTETLFFKYCRYLMRNILCIPSDILLPEDLVHEGLNNSKSSDLKMEMDKFETLVDEVKKAKKRKVLVERELKESEDLRRMQEEVISANNDGLLQECKEVEDELDAFRDKKRDIESLRNFIFETKSNLERLDLTLK